MITEASTKRGGLFSTPEKGKQWLSQTQFHPETNVRIEVSEEQIAAAYEYYRNKLGQFD